MKKTPNHGAGLAFEGGDTGFGVALRVSRVVCILARSLSARIRNPHVAQGMTVLVEGLRDRQCSAHGLGTLEGPLQCEGIKKTGAVVFEDELALAKGRGLRGRHSRDAVAVDLSGVRQTRDVGLGDLRLTRRAGPHDVVGVLDPGAADVGFGSLGVGAIACGDPLKTREIKGHAAIVVEDDLADGFARRATRHVPAAQGSLNDLGGEFAGAIALAAAHLKDGIDDRRPGVVTIGSDPVLEPAPVKAPLTDDPVILERDPPIRKK